MGVGAEGSVIDGGTNVVLRAVLALLRHTTLESHQPALALCWIVHRGGSRRPGVADKDALAVARNGARRRLRMRMGEHMHSHACMTTPRPLLLAQVGHFFFQRNKPATFQYPLWSFLGDWVMWYKILSGTMDAEVERVLCEHDASGRRK